MLILEMVSPLKKKWYFMLSVFLCIVTFEVNLVLELARL